MIRDLPRLAEREFDVLVVGGGIYGLAIAYDAAQRGLATALVDRGDFGAATSFNHLKTIHGGLRYLQSADLRRMRESVRERRAFARIAPRFVAPLRFVMPAGGSITRSPLAFRAAFALDAILSRDRNDEVDPGRRLPAGRLVPARVCRDVFDGARAAPRWAAEWHDYQTIDGDRITLAFAKAAARHGACLANYVEAAAALRQDARLAGVAARDVLTGDRFEIRARVVVNAAGPWGADLLGGAGGTGRGPLLKAMNLVTSRPARPAALVAPTSGGRALVLMPWRGRSVVGTSESRDARQPDDQEATRSEVDGFLDEINETFPALNLRFSEVTLVHRGIVPGVVQNGRLTLLGQSQIVDGAAAGVPELVSVVGVKYTTARAVAERVVDLVFGKLGRAPVPCRTGATVLPGAGLTDRDPADPIAHAISDEMAQTLADVVVRRTGLGAAGFPGEEVAATVAGRMQGALGWPEARVERELAALRAVYRIT